MAGSTLQCVDFVRPDGTPTQGLVSVGKSDISGLSIDEQAAVSDARLLQHVDFIFFRRYGDGRSSQVAAYVVEPGIAARPDMEPTLMIAPSPLSTR